MAGFLTPTHLLLLLAIVAAFVILGRLTRADAGERAAGHGREVRKRLQRGFRLRLPTRREAHVMWLIFSVIVALALTRGVALPLFILVFFVLWLAGFGVLARLYR